MKKSTKNNRNIIIVATSLAIIALLLAIWKIGISPDSGYENTNNTNGTASNTCKEKREGGYIAEFIAPPPSTLAELANKSDAIVVAEVVSCGVDSKKLSSVKHTFDVESVVKGSLKSGEITISVDKDYRTPLLSDGDQVVLFLEKHQDGASGYRLFYSGSTIAFKTGDQEYSFSDKAELPIPQTFNLSEL